MSVVRIDPAEESESSLLLAAIVESSADAIFATSLLGKILSWNRAAESLYGYRAAQVVGRNAEYLFPEDRQLDVRRIFGRVELGQPVERFVTVGRKKNGELINVSLSVSPVYSADGEVLAASVIARDITERLRTVNARVREAEEAERAKTKLISTVSHELRTPLAAIRGYISTVLDYGDRLSDAEKIEYLRFVDDAAKHLEKMVSDLLTLSRLDSGVLDLNVEVVDVAELLRSVASVHELIDDHPIRVSLPKKKLVARVDPFRMRQVLTNLLDNAMKYSPRGTKINLIGRLNRDGAVEIVVRDYGPGVAPGETRAIFESFYRSRTPMHSMVKGSGLGLAICRGIVLAHGGRIWANLPKGGGLRITVQLPAHPPTTSD